VGEVPKAAANKKKKIKRMGSSRGGEIVRKPLSRESSISQKVLQPFILGGGGVKKRPACFFCRCQGGRLSFWPRLRKETGDGERDGFQQECVVLQDLRTGREAWKLAARMKERGAKSLGQRHRIGESGKGDS